MDEGFRTAVLAYYGAMERLAVVLEEIMAAALGLPAEYFVQRADRSITNMVGFSFAMGKAGNAVPPHDDEGDFTILSHDAIQAGVPSGLEIQLPEGSELAADQAGTGEAPWVAVEPVPGCFVVNTGNLMHRFSGGRFQTTIHRVRVDHPQPGAPRRQSIAFFHLPNADTVVAPVLPPPEDSMDVLEPVVAGLFVLERLKVLLPG